MKFFRASNGSYRSFDSDFLFARVIRVIVLWRVRFILRLRQSEFHYLSVITELTTLGVISKLDSINTFEYEMITLYCSEGIDRSTLSFSLTVGMHEICSGDGTSFVFVVFIYLFILFLNGHLSNGRRILKNKNADVFSSRYYGIV